MTQKYESVISILGIFAFEHIELLRSKRSRTKTYPIVVLLIISGISKGPDRRVVAPRPWGQSPAQRPGNLPLQVAGRTPMDRPLKGCVSHFVFV